MGGRHRWIALRTALAATAGLLALTACEASGPSTAPATSAPAASSSGSAGRPATIPSDVPASGPNLLSPAEAPPAEPAVAAQRTSAGAGAFARFFLLTVDWGFATTSGAYMAHYFDPSCDECLQLQSGLNATATQGWHFVGGRYTIKDVAVTDDSTDHHTATIHAAVSPSKTVDASGAEQTSAAAIADVTLKLDLSWESTGWLVDRIDSDTGS